jgi:hypothetical protein
MITDCIERVNGTDTHPEPIARNGSRRAAEHDEHIRSHGEPEGPPPQAQRAAGDARSRA